MEVQAVDDQLGRGGVRLTCNVIAGDRNSCSVASADVSIVLQSGTCGFSRVSPVSAKSRSTPPHLARFGKTGGWKPRVPGPALGKNAAGSRGYQVRLLARTRLEAAGTRSGSWQERGWKPRVPGPALGKNAAGSRGYQVRLLARTRLEAAGTRSGGWKPRVPSPAAGSRGYQVRLSGSY